MYNTFSEGSMVVSAITCIRSHKPYERRPDMTFAVDWALKTNHLSTVRLAFLVLRSP